MSVSSQQTRVAHSIFSQLGLEECLYIFVKQKELTWFAFPLKQEWKLQQEFFFSLFIFEVGI